MKHSFIVFICAILTISLAGSRFASADFPPVPHPISVNVTHVVNVAYGGGSNCYPNPGTCPTFVMARFYSETRDSDGYLVVKSRNIAFQTDTKAAARCAQLLESAKQSEIPLVISGVGLSTQFSGLFNDNILNLESCTGLGY